MIRFSLVAALLLASCTTPIAAQSLTPSRYELAAGYMFMRDQDIAESNPEISANFPRGWTVGGAAGVRPWLDAVGELSGSYKTVSILGDEPRIRVHTFMGGPRMTARAIGHVAPFGQVLFGAARATTIVLKVSDTVTDFAWQPGGGIDVTIHPRIGMRLGGDYRLVRAEGRNSKEPRFAVAALFRFGQ